MDFHKLKVDSFNAIAVLNLPAGIELTFTPVEQAGDCLLAYPKGTSKTYSAEINRDSIVAAIKAAGGFKAPKLVSLDKDWSGFSFKHVG